MKRLKLKQGVKKFLGIILLLKLKQGVKDFLGIVLLYLIVILGVVLINARLGELNQQKNTSEQNVTTRK